MGTKIQKIALLLAAGIVGGQIMNPAVEPLAATAPARGYEALKSERERLASLQTRLSRQPASEYWFVPHVRERLLKAFPPMSSSAGYAKNPATLEAFLSEPFTPFYPLEKPS